MSPEEMTKMLMEIREGQISMKGEIEALRGEQKSTWRRIDEQGKVTESVHQLALSVRDLANAQENTSRTLVALQKDTETDIRELRADVTELKLKPAKRWDGAVGTLIASAVAAVIAFLAARVGLK